MTNSQIITIPLTSDLDLSVLLEIAQSIAEELQDLIEDAGSDCEIDEQDICVEDVGSDADGWTFPCLENK